MSINKLHSAGSVRFAVLRRAADRDGVAVLIVEEQMRRALSVADRWYLLNAGAITARRDADLAGARELEDGYLASLGMPASET